MRQIWKIIRNNYWIIDHIVSELNKKMDKDWDDKIFTRWNFQPIINNWSRKNVSIKNKILITEAINNILWTKYTINDLEQEVEN